MPNLAELIGKPGAEGVDILQAKVTGTPSAGKAKIRFGDLAHTTTADDIDSVPILGSAVIVNGDTVWVLRKGGALLILGRVSFGENVAFGRRTEAGNINGNGAMALGQGSTERAFTTSPAVQTYAGRRYRIEGMITFPNSGTWNWLWLRIRRGTTTAGTQVGWRSHAKANTLGYQETVPVVAWDTPGAQAAQQWCVTSQFDTGAGDVYGPDWIQVDDIGAA